MTVLAGKNLNFCYIMSCTCLSSLKMFRVHQRSGERIMLGNGCLKGCFWRVRCFSAHLRFSGVLRANFKGAEKKRTLQKPFWTTVSPHDAFSTPLVHPQMSFFPGDFESAKMPQISRKNNSQGSMFVMISCQRVAQQQISGPSGRPRSFSTGKAKVLIFS